jgi:predicted DNA-binding protein
MKKRPMIRFALYLSEIELKRLTAVSKKTGLSIAEIIRRILDAGLSEYEKGIEKKK